MAGLDETVLARYLQRLGVEREPPSPEALARLHRAHVERVAWECLWIHLGDDWPLDPVASAARLVDRGRAGYCFHLNGAFHEMLVALGYRVVRHAAVVHRPGAGPAATPDHLTLTVSGLASEANPEGRWLADVGLGSGLHQPLPLSPGTTSQGRLRFDLDRTGGVEGGWRLARTPPSGWEAITWWDRPATMTAFATSHQGLSRSPGSPFARVLTVQRWRGGGHDVLRGLTLHTAEGTTTTIGSQPDLLAVLDGRFGIDLGDTEGAVIDRLWTDLAAAHESWVAAGRP